MNGFIWNLFVPLHGFYQQSHEIVVSTFKIDYNTLQYWGNEILRLKPKVAKLKVTTMKPHENMN